MMAMSEACLAGIKANGLRWKHRIRLGQWPALLGKLNDQGDAVADDAEVERYAMKIVELVRAFVRRNAWAQETDLDRRADELEMVADCGLGEVNFAMNELYDSFDYWRILVEAPRLPTPAPDASPSASSAPAAVAVPSTSALATDGADRGEGE
jgi:hypothetical protein